MSTSAIAKIRAEIMRFVFIGLSRLPDKAIPFFQNSSYGLVGPLATGVSLGTSVGTGVSVGGITM